MNLTKIISKEVKQCTATEQYGTTKHEKNIVTTIVTTTANVTVNALPPKKKPKNLRKKYGQNVIKVISQHLLLPLVNG